MSAAACGEVAGCEGSQAAGWSSQVLGWCQQQALVWPQWLVQCQKLGWCQVLGCLAGGVQGQQAVLWLAQIGQKSGWGCGLLSTAQTEVPSGCSYVLQEKGGTGTIVGEDVGSLVVVGS